MFELTVERVFCAAHAIMIGGRREPVHGHNWQVTAAVRGAELDSDGLVCDFHLLERVLDEVIGPFHNADLCGVAPFTDVNPTAENVARHIGESLGQRLSGRIGSAQVAWVRVTEAPGCAATYWTSWWRGAGRPTS